MEKQTLYEILEVSENASPEIIEKAYKVLAKKYHPDLQDISEKQKAEERMKKINEAYDILGNENTRKKYDDELKQKRQKEKINYYEEQKKYTENYNSNAQNETQVNYDYEKDRLKFQEKLKREEAEQREKMQENLNKEYENIYYNYLRSLGYKVKHKWTKENIVDFIIVIVIMAVIIIGLWFIPPTHNWMVNFYENNPILKTIIDIIIGIVTGIFTGVWKFITQLFT